MERHDAPGAPSPTAGDAVGLGHVVEDHRPAGDRGTPRGSDAAPDGPPDALDDEAGVESASEDSFPASDPPAFTVRRAGGAVSGRPSA